MHPAWETYQFPNIFLAKVFFFWPTLRNWLISKEINNKWLVKIRLQEIKNYEPTENKFLLKLFQLKEVIILIKF